MDVPSGGEKQRMAVSEHDGIMSSEPSCHCQLDHVGEETWDVALCTIDRC